jgi:transposase
LRTKLANQLIATLKGYFPQALSLLGESVHAPMACDFLSKWNTSDQLAKARPQTVREFYYAHNCRSERRIQERLQTIADLSSLTTDTAIVNSSIMKVRMLVRQLRPLNKSIEEYDRLLKTLLKKHPDAELYTCLPGAGAALAPRLLAALGNDRDRFASATAIQCLSGIAPVTKRSGKRCSVQRRWACAKFLRQSFHEFAHHSRRQSPWAKAFYQSQREKGKAHHAAIRALAFKWLRVLYRCWKTKTPYNETVYLDSLKRRNSPLLKYLDQPSTACV